MIAPRMIFLRQIPFFAIFLLSLLVGSIAQAGQMDELPIAKGSPTAGINFDDNPLLLPSQRNFQMAMLTTSSELGRSCGHIEVYGWRMEENEQGRVNGIFNNTVDRLRAQGFSVESQFPKSVSEDVTVFTADRPGKNLIFMWSAGEIGLVMVLCETSAPKDSAKPASAPNTYKSPLMSEPAKMTYGRNQKTVHELVDKGIDASFSPLGTWVGSYSCMQGYTGGTLRVSSLDGAQVQGTFRFYPTAKNPNSPAGEYKVFGEYDRESQRILLNPGEWIKRPQGYANTIMIGSFDAMAKSFSGFFQGINGCTSFEAKQTDTTIKAPTKKAATKKVAAKKKAAKKKIVKKKKKKVTPKKAAPKVEPKIEPKVELKVEPKVETKVEPKVETKVEPKVEPAIAPKAETPETPSPKKEMAIPEDILLEIKGN